MKKEEKTALIRPRGKAKIQVQHAPMPADLPPNRSLNPVTAHLDRSDPVEESDRLLLMVPVIQKMTPPPSAAVRRNSIASADPVKMAATLENLEKHSPYARQTPRRPRRRQATARKMHFPSEGEESPRPSAKMQALLEEDQSEDLQQHSKLVKTILEDQEFSQTKAAVGLVQLTRIAEENQLSPGKPALSR